MRRAAARTLRIGVRLVGLFAAMGAIAWGARELHDFATTSPRLAIAHFDVSGNERTPSELLIAASGFAIGDNLFDVDLAAARRRLLELPWIAEARLRRSFPQGIRITVLEREALALVDLGNLYLIDQQGEVFKRALPGDPIDLPVITGLPRGEWQTRPEETKAKLDEALQALDAYGRSELWRSLPLSEVNLDPAEGVTLYLGEKAMAAKLGHGDFEGKLARLMRVIEAAKRRGEELELVRLDNRARPGWIAARLFGDGAAD